MLREFETRTEPRPKITLPKLAAYLLATFVHALTVALVLIGVLALLSGNIVLAALGILALALAWLFRPRVPEAPAGEPAELPHLRQLADDIAAEVGTRPADEIVVTDEFNAAVGSAGWRQRRYLSVGLPLFAVLDGQERVAVLAHEFGHFANGDPRRGFFVGTALHSLLAWHGVLSPESVDEGRDWDDLGIFAPFVNAIMAVLSLVPLAVASLLATLIARETQRGEYLADMVAARVAGSAAVISAWDKIHLEPVFEHAASAKSAGAWRNGSLWDELRHKAEQVPASELRRARARDRKLGTRLDVTHPPTSSRIDVVLARPQLPKKVQLSEPKSEQIDEELTALLPRLQSVIIDRHLDSLYAG